MIKLELYEILNIISSILIVAAAWKQLMIAVRIDWRHFKFEYTDNTKVLFLVFNIAILFGMWLPYLNQLLWSSICLLCAAIIAFYTYYWPSIRDGKWKKIKRWWKKYW